MEPAAANMVIPEAELTLQERARYIQAVHQFEWSKLELTRKIRECAHEITALDSAPDLCYSNDGRGNADGTKETSGAYKVMYHVYWQHDHTVTSLQEETSMRKVISLFVIMILLISIISCTKTPIWQEQYDLGVRYMSDGDYEEAIIAFTAAIEIDPRQASAYIGRGDANMALFAVNGNNGELLRQAADDFTEAIAIDPSIIEAYSMLSEVYLKLGDVEKAIGILHEGFEVTGDSSLRTSEEELTLSYASVDISINRQDITYTSELTGISTPLHYDLVTVKGDDPRINRINEAILEDFGKFKIAGGAAAEDIDLFGIGVRHEWMYRYLNSAADNDPNFIPCEVSAEITCNGNGILSIRYTSHYIYDYYCEYGMTFDLLTGERLSYMKYFSENKDDIITKIRTQLQTIIDEQWAMGLDGIHAALEEDFNFSLLDFYIQDNELIVCSPRMFAGDGSVWTTAIPCSVYIDEW